MRALVKADAKPEAPFTAPSPDVFGRRRSRLWRASTLGFSRLALQLIVVALAGLSVVLVLTLIAADHRRGAADAVTQSLLVQSDALVETLRRAHADTRLYTVSVAGAPEESGQARPRPAGTVTTEINRPEVDKVLRDILEGSQTRMRMFGADGGPLTDTTIAVVPIEREPGSDGITGRVWEMVAGSFLSPSLPLEPPREAPVEAFPEVQYALGGVKSAVYRTDEDGNIIVSVAAPIFEDEMVVAALHLSSVEGSITAVARAQELSIVRVFVVAALVAVTMCIILAAAISRPIRRLATAADRIRRGGVSAPIPELRDGGEIGELSRVLHDMTAALYARIDAIEAFAGEVAHELKNPLTSLRSAVETLPVARTDADRRRLLDVIQHDIQRVDRLITDISDASKLDAELNRHRYERFNLTDILRMIVQTQAELGAERGQMIELVVRGDDDGHAFQVIGNDSRLSQVFTNLIDNARSFTPDGGRVVTTAQRFFNFIEVVVDDEGPGIEDEMLERIFERFYTYRPDQQQFGNNSGLGLAISRQIVEAHNGEIFAENRYRTTLGPDRNIAGARFTVRLPSVT